MGVLYRELREGRVSSQLVACKRLAQFGRGGHRPISIPWPVPRGYRIAHDTATPDPRPRSLPTPSRSGLPSTIRWSLPIVSASFPWPRLLATVGSYPTAQRQRWLSLRLSFPEHVQLRPSSGDQLLASAETRLIQAKSCPMTAFSFNVQIRQIFFFFAFQSDLQKHSFFSPKKICVLHFVLPCMGCMEQNETKRSSPSRSFESFSVFYFP